MRRCPPTAVALLLAAALTVNPSLVALAEEPGIISRIQRIPVESTAIGAVGYSKRLRALEIEFRNGAIYRYLAVAPDVYEALLKAPSKARFYDQNIRHKYRSRHVRRPSG
jgi:KTSC domain